MGQSKTFLGLQTQNRSARSGGKKSAQKGGKRNFYHRKKTGTGVFQRGGTPLLRQPGQGVVRGDKRCGEEANIAAVIGEAGNQSEGGGKNIIGGARGITRSQWTWMRHKKIWLGMKWEERQSAAGLRVGIMSAPVGGVPSAINKRAPSVIMANNFCENFGIPTKIFWRFTSIRCVTMTTIGDLYY